MVQLQPELDKRGFDLAVFHTTGMGGRAFESLAAQGQFACVMDFSLQEMVNQMGGSVVSAGPDRLMGAGLKGVPMIVAPGPPIWWITRLGPDARALCRATLARPQPPDRLGGHRRRHAP
jgi:hypothetical protein